MTNDTAVNFLPSFFFPKYFLFVPGDNNGDTAVEHFSNSLPVSCMFPMTHNIILK